MDFPAHKVRTFMDALTVIFVIAVIALLGMRYFPHHATAPTATQPLLQGMHLSVAALDWKDHSLSVVLVLSAHCPACDLSAGLYQDLINNANGSYKVVAVLPEGHQAANQYLTSLALNIPEVRQQTPESMGVMQVPTLLIVDSSGVVKRLWLGVIPHAKERDVYGMLKITRGVPDVEHNMVTASELAQLRGRPGRLPVVDTRPRELYRAGHIKESLSIPPDELTFRLPIELALPRATLVAVHCDFCDKCMRQTGSEPNESAPLNCYDAAERFRRLGFIHVKYLSASVEDLRHAGLSISDGSQ